MRRLDEVCEVIRGSSPRPIKQYLTEADDGVNWVKIGDATQSGKYITSTKQKITPKGAERSRKVSPGDLLLSNSMSYGQAYIMGMDGYVHDGWFVLRKFSDVFELEFLYNVLISNFVQKQFGILAAGAVVKNISSDLVKKAILPVPPKAEQKRIVAILDEAFGAIDRAKEIATQNVASARELFESYLNRVFTEKGEGWEEKKLQEISQINSGGTPLKSTKEFWDGGDIPWYSSGELNDLFTTESNKYITEAGLKGSNAKLFPKGSLLMGMYDTAALKMSILDREGTFNQAVAGMLPVESVDSRFILYAVRHVRPEVLKLRRGVRQKNLSLAKIKAIKIYLPLRADAQQKVAEDIAVRKQFSRDLADKGLRKLAALDELKQSILQKAFTGRLAEKAPELEAVG